MPAHPARLDAGDGERGSVAMALIVIVVATVMVVALLVTTQIGLRSARRAGDSANTLQLADAGINDAAKAITAHTGGFSGGSSLGTAGSYAYTATKDGAVWRLDATGTDASGVKRRVLADAVDQALFGHAFFALAASELKGTADSYTGPSNTCATSPGMGVVGSNGSITFTGGTGASNCRGALHQRRLPERLGGRAADQRRRQRHRDVRKPRRLLGRDQRPQQRGHRQRRRHPAGGDIRLGAGQQRRRRRPVPVPLRPGAQVVAHHRSVPRHQLARGGERLRCGSRGWCGGCRRRTGKAH